MKRNSFKDNWHGRIIRAGCMIAVAGTVLLHSAIPAYAFRVDVSSDAAQQVALNDYAGPWVLDEEPNSELIITPGEGNTIEFDASFYRLAAFLGQADITKMNTQIPFQATDGSEFSGWIMLGDYDVTLHTNSMNGMYTDYMDDHTFVYHRGEGFIPVYSGTDGDTENSSGEQPFTITPEDLESEIEKIRDHYYNPGDGDIHYDLQNGDWGINYSRMYYYYQGDLIFAFIFDGGEEHRLYFKDDHMIRYIDENMVTYDFPATDAYTDWEEWALEEAYLLFPKPETEAGAEQTAQGNLNWLGTWTADNGDYLEIYEQSETQIELVFHKTTEAGAPLAPKYTLYFSEEDEHMAEEPVEVEYNAGWRYFFHLDGDRITVYSRYLDQVFYRQ